MQVPYLRPIRRKRVLIDRFRGLTHGPGVTAGAFYDMENLSGARAPLIGVRPNRTELSSLDGCPTTGVLALGGRGVPVVLDRWGTLWCGGASLPRLLEGDVDLEIISSASVQIGDRDQILSALRLPGSYRYRYSTQSGLWYSESGSGTLSGDALVSAESLPDNFTLELDYSYTLHSSAPRELVFLGGWALVFPDKRFVNTVKLREGGYLTEGEDYGSIDQENLFEDGRVRLSPCDSEGQARSVTRSAAAPQGGYWLDSAEPIPVLRVLTQSTGQWVETASYVKCSIPGIAKQLRAGDCVELYCHLDTEQGGEAKAEALWTGFHVLTAVWHDPGGDNRPEGEEDYVIFPGLLDESLELELSRWDRGYFSIKRAMPEMDFVVEAGNRLWGCRRAGNLNELYGSKLGDFRNWNVFEGLSTDSYRVSRGHDGPYTGAAVLDGCPLFFRADSVEKLHPDPGGAHGVVTVQLAGIEAGSAKSAVVLGNSLYYKSPMGICRYSGTLPLLVSKDLGDRAYTDAVAGAMGSRYCVSMRDPWNREQFFILDTETGLWYREDGPGLVGTYSLGKQLYLLRGPERCPLVMAGGETSEGVAWYAETGELIPRLGTRRYVTRLQVTAQVEAGAELRLLLSYDGGPWEQVGAMESKTRRSLSYPIFPRRCDRLRLRLEGRGGMELRQLSWLTEAGSDVNMTP